LFSGSEGGAESWAILSSIVNACFGKSGTAISVIRGQGFQ
jgi:hypothetical protein